jgi:hypothetical protein
MARDRPIHQGTRRNRRAEGSRRTNRLIDVPSENQDHNGFAEESRFSERVRDPESD